jgi:hypothetical protein
MRLFLDFLALRGVVGRWFHGHITLLLVKIVIVHVDVSGY